MSCIESHLAHSFALQLQQIWLLCLYLLVQLHVLGKDLELELERRCWVHFRIFFLCLLLDFLGFRHVRLTVNNVDGFVDVFHKLFESLLSEENLIGFVQAEDIKRVGVVPNDS